MIVIDLTVSICAYYGGQDLKMLLTILKLVFFFIYKIESNIMILF